MDDITKCSGGNCTFKINLKNNYNMNWFGGIDMSMQRNYTTYCSKGISKTVEYYCQERNISAVCNGSYDGAIMSRCPLKTTKPACRMFYADEIKSCDVISYNSIFTTCHCVISLTTTNSLARKPIWHFTRPENRRLLSGSSKAYQFTTR